MSNLTCERCKAELVTGGIASIARWVFCYDCGIRVVDYFEDGGRKWKYIPNGFLPVYVNGNIVNIIDTKGKPTEEKKELRELVDKPVIETIQVQSIKRGRGRPRKVPVNVDQIIKQELNEIKENNKEE